MRPGLAKAQGVPADRCEEFELRHKRPLGPALAQLDLEHNESAYFHDHYNDDPNLTTDEEGGGRHPNDSAHDLHTSRREAQSTTSKTSSSGRHSMAVTLTRTFEAVTKKPAGTIFPSQTSNGHSEVSLDSEYSRTGMKLRDVLDPDNFYPFADRQAFLNASWMFDDQLSAGTINRQPQPKSFKNWQEYKQTLHDIPYGIFNDTWQSADFNGPSAYENAVRDKYTVHYRSIVRTIAFLISYLPFKDHLSYAPIRNYAGEELLEENDDGPTEAEYSGQGTRIEGDRISRRTDEDGEETEPNSPRVYTEMHTADWWWLMQEKLPPHATVVPLLIHTDKTTLSQHQGDVTAYPVYLSIGNLDHETRRSQKLPGTILIGFLPCTKKGTHKDLKHEIYHTAMRVITERKQSDPTCRCQTDLGDR